MNIIQQLEREQAEKIAGKRQVPDFSRRHRGGGRSGQGRRAFPHPELRRRGHCPLGCGLNENFTVRKISYGEGVERVFPVYSPLVEGIKVVRRGKVRRAKLYYLRGPDGQIGTYCRADARGGVESAQRPRLPLPGR